MAVTRSVAPGSLGPGTGSVPVPVSTSLLNRRTLVGPVQAGAPLTPALNAMRRAAAVSRANAIQAAFTPQTVSNQATLPSNGAPNQLPGLPPGAVRPQTREEGLQYSRTSRYGIKDRAAAAKKRGILKGPPSSSLSVTPELLRRIARQTIERR